MSSDRNNQIYQILCVQLWRKLDGHATLFTCIYVKLYILQTINLADITKIWTFQFWGIQSCTETAGKLSEYDELIVG